MSWLDLVITFPPHEARATQPGVRFAPGEAATPWDPLVDVPLAEWGAAFTTRWRQVDALALLEEDEDARARHDFQLVDDDDRWRTAQTYGFPPPHRSKFQAKGLGHQSGRAELTFTGLTPGTDTLLVVLTFMRDLLPERILSVDGVELCTLPGRPWRSAGWSNTIVELAGRWITSRSVRLALRIPAGSDASYFRLWCFQRR